MPFLGLLRTSQMRFMADWSCASTAVAPNASVKRLTMPETLPSDGRSRAFSTTSSTAAPPSEPISAESSSVKLCCAHGPRSVAIQSVRMTNGAMDRAE
jgi:hypothetical protein